MIILTIKTKGQRTFAQPSYDIRGGCIIVDCLQGDEVALTVKDGRTVDIFNRRFLNVLRAQRDAAHNRTDIRLAHRVKTDLLGADCEGSHQNSWQDGAADLPNQRRRFLQMLIVFIILYPRAA